MFAFACVLIDVKSLDRILDFSDITCAVVCSNLTDLHAS